MTESRGAFSRYRHVLDSRGINRTSRGILNTARLASLSFVLLFLVLSPKLRASICVPLGDGVIHFSTVLRIQPAASSSAPVDAWVLSNHSVYRVSPQGHVDTWSLQGQLQRDAFVVYRGAVFVGTTEGAMRFAPDEPDVSLDFRDGVSGALGNSRPAIYFASVAFDTVLLSGMSSVYAVDKSGKDAFRISLPPGRAYGQNPYWWVTKSGVYRLAADFSVSEPLTIEQPASDPVVVADRLWFASHSYRLISVPKDAPADLVPNLPGRVLSVSATQGADPSTVWAATDKALERVHLTGTAKDRPTFIVSDEVTEGNIEKVLVLADRLFFRRCATQNDPKDSDKGCSPTVLEELTARVGAQDHGKGDAPDCWRSPLGPAARAVPSTPTASISLTGEGLPGALGGRSRLWWLLGDANRFLQPLQAGLERFQDIRHRGWRWLRCAQLQLFAPDFGINQSPQVLAVAIPILRRLEACRQRFHQQMGQFQFLGCHPLGVGAELVERPDFVAVEQRMEQQSEAAGAEQDQVFAAMHGQLRDAHVSGAAHGLVE
jgi:hypothetical protein